MSLISQQMRRGVLIIVAKIGSGQSHSFCNGGTLGNGNGYIRTSQTRNKDNKRKSKEYIYNYVDRVRFAESSFPDYKLPLRGSGWRHNKSISHLDLATSCHSAAAGLNHWSPSHQTRHHQLRHSRSLDYNHIDRCKDALDIAEYYWRVEPEPDIYDEDEEEIIETEQQQQQQQQLKYVSEQHLTQHYRDFKCVDENYHHSTNNIYQSSQQLQHQQQQLQQQQQQQHQARQQIKQQQHQTNGPAQLPLPPPPPLPLFEFANDSCSLRRSRSLAVIREETFSDLQINSSNGSRRSQLIPRARLVNRGYFRERDRLICGNNKHNRYHHTSREKLTNCNCNNSGCNNLTAAAVGGNVNGCYCQEEPDALNNETVADNCEVHKQNQKTHQHLVEHLHYHPQYHDNQSSIIANNTSNDYYEHLKRLDKLALGLVTEQFHPWHNDKSDLESLNSDYFKNSLHQSNDLKQQQQQLQQQQQHIHQHPQVQQLEFESIEHAVQLLANQEKPRIYQSRRQKRTSPLGKTHKFSTSTPASGGESCPETSQSSVFPETTTSNSDDQTDSASLSEQEYDITKIEEIFQKTQIEGNEECYEIISLTTTTRTRIETTEDEAEDLQDFPTNKRNIQEHEREQEQERERERDCLVEEEHINRHRILHNSNDISQQGQEEDNEDEESNRHTTTDTEIEGTLKRARAISDNLQKIIAYDSVYLSSEESSDSTLIDVDACGTSLDVASICTCIDEVETLLHISIEDAIYEPQAKQHKFEENSKTHSQPDTVSFVETVNTKIEILDHCETIDVDELKPIYRQILKIEHTPCTNIVQQQHTASNVGAGVTSSAASKPKILSVVEKRKLKRYSDSAYSSKDSDSSDKGLLTPPTTTDSSSASSYTLVNHLKRQVAEPLYIPLKTNLNHNQYHSLPDVNIGQSLKVSESIDAQLRSSYNLDNYCSLDVGDDDASIVDCNLPHHHEISDETLAKPLTLVGSHINSSSSSNSSDNLSKRQSHEEVITPEEIYDSIKRFGKAHQKFREKENKAFEKQQKIAEEEKRVLQQYQDCWSVESSLEEVVRDKPSAINKCKDFNENIKEKTTTEVPKLPPTEGLSLTQKNQDTSIENKPTDQSFSTIRSQTPESYSPPSNYDSLEKPKDAPGVEIENFSQQIERRAKEIRASARRTQQQQIEFANRAKFRLENTLQSYEAVDETKEQTYKQTKKNSIFRIVVTDAQNNIIEEDSIESQSAIPKEEEKENFHFNNQQQVKRLENNQDLLMVKFSKDRLKDKSNLSGSLKRVPSKHKRQQYPTAATTAASPSQHLSLAEAQKILLSPKAKERRVLSNQIYRARPVKVITTTTTTTTTTTSDSFRRNKVKHQSNKMSRPQILQVIDNKKKLETALAAATGMTNGSATTAAAIFNASQQQQNNKNHEAASQVENEYLKKVDAARCYWSKLISSDGLETTTPRQKEEYQQQQQQHQQQQQKYISKKEMKNDTKQQLTQNNEQSNEQEDKEQKSCMKLPASAQQQLQSKKTNDTENLIESQQPQQHQVTYQEKKQFILGKQQPKKSSNEVDIQERDRNSNTTSGDIIQDDYCSFMPSIEIVELDGDKKATLVSAVPAMSSSLPANKDANSVENHDANEPQFDHIRYKVLKSQQLLRNNILPRNKKEAQFDGLIQYLQEYSFQELLSNNNVVIVEPVRTKIERPIDSYNTKTNKQTKNSTTAEAAAASAIKSGTQTDKTNKQKTQQHNCSGYGSSNGGGGGGGIKRHFFYQPVRVNRELYEEELPNPDTVRTVRKFFEEHVLPTPGQGLLAKVTNPTTSFKQTSPKSRRARKYRYLTIDTSYGHATNVSASTNQKPTSATTTIATANSNAQSRKWDTASMSSGISSGDLSSPCECNDNEKCPESPSKKHINKETSTNDNRDNQPVHVQELVRKHNSSVKKTRSTAYGIPVRSSAVRPRSAIYGSLHKSSNRTNSYRDTYEYHLKHAHLDSDHEAGNNDGDNNVCVDDANADDLFGDVEDDEDAMCDTYYVSNDVLRKIREYGSSVTYYGGRVVQTSSSALTSTAANPLETYNCGNNNGCTAVKNTVNNNATILALKNPTMTTQTQTMARVREIETCCSAASTVTQVVTCSSKASNDTNNECHFHGKQLEQKIKNKNELDDYNRRTVDERNHFNNNNNGDGDGDGFGDNNNMNHKAQGLKKEGNRPTDYNKGSGITFKLVKSNSCSSRLELAGASDINDHDDEPEETEVVRKMVHHFEASAIKQFSTSNSGNNETTFTINNQTTAAFSEQPTKVYSAKTGEANQQAIEKKYHDCDIKLVTVNNHINIAKENSIEMTKKPTATTPIASDLKDISSKCEKDTEFLKKDEQKTYQTEAKGIYLEHNIGCGSSNVVGVGGSCGETNVKVCRNKNVDLAFTFVKQTSPKSLGINTEIAKNNTNLDKENLKLNKQNNPLQNNDEGNENKNSKVLTKNANNLSNDEAHKNKIQNSNSNSTISSITNKPSQIVVPIEIHRVDDNQLTTDDKNSNFSKASNTNTDGKEKHFSSVSSISSVIDKTVVKYYVANDKSIYEKRKYDDIEFEEFEIYDPTKDFEKLIEDEQKRHNSCTQQHSTLSSTTSSTSNASTTTATSMVTAKSQQTAGTASSTTETETDCYDSLDDKL